MDSADFAVSLQITPWYQQALHRARATVLILGSSDAGSVGLSAISDGKVAFGAGISARRTKQSTYGDATL